MEQTTEFSEQTKAPCLIPKFKGDRAGEIYLGPDTYTASDKEVQKQSNCGKNSIGWVMVIDNVKFVTHTTMHFKITVLE